VCVGAFLEVLEAVLLQYIAGRPAGAQLLDGDVSGRFDLVS
jgi:hypothetical protein